MVGQRLGKARDLWPYFSVVGASKKHCFEKRSKSIRLTLGESPIRFGQSICNVPQDRNDYCEIQVAHR